MDFKQQRYLNGLSDPLSETIKIVKRGSKYTKLLAKHLE